MWRRGASRGDRGCWSGGDVIRVHVASWGQSGQQGVLEWWCRTGLMIACTYDDED